MAKKVLMAGESWTSTTMEVKGFNSFLTSKYETGMEYIEKAMENAGYQLTYLTNHEAAEKFPFFMDEIEKYDCIILSDIGADTLLVPPETFTFSKKFPNRCQLIKDYVLQGGGLLMVGGYMTFSGIGGQGKWWATPVQDVLPVKLLPYDDRMEHCEGVQPAVIDRNHPVLRGINVDFPFVLGYNKSIVNPEAELAATVCDDPFLAFENFDKGRSGIIATDCAPHWAPPEFCEWEYYNLLFKNIIDYLTKSI